MGSGRKRKEACQAAWGNLPAGDCPGLQTEVLKQDLHCWEETRGYPRQNSNPRGTELQDRISGLGFKKESRNQFI